MTTHTTTVRFRIIFDNAGGALLVVPGAKYAHHYDRPEQLADDVKTLMLGETREQIRFWEGNEWEYHGDAEADAREELVTSKEICQMLAGGLPGYRANTHGFMQDKFCELIGIGVASE